MIDIHSHALYECDDGSTSIEQSLEMIRTANDIGVTDIFFTPHYMEDGYKNDREVVYQKIDTLKQKLATENINVNLHCGEEVFIFPHVDEEVDEKIICLNNSRYVLIELPLIENVNYLADVVYNLLSKGKVPIIAHPERYFIVEKDISFVENLIDKGALIQINANSLVGRYGKEAEKLAIKLLKRNMVHFVASDAHSVHGYKLLSESMERLKELVSEDKFNEITRENQKKIILDQEIDSKDYIKAQNTKFFWLPFLNRKGAK